MIAVKDKALNKKYKGLTDAVVKDIWVEFRLQNVLNINNSIVIL